MQYAVNRNRSPPRGGDRQNSPKGSPAQRIVRNRSRSISNSPDAQTVAQQATPSPATQLPVPLDASPAGRIDRDMYLNTMLESLEELLDAEVAGPDEERVSIPKAVQILVDTVNTEWGGIQYVSEVNRKRFTTIKKQVNLLQKTMVQPREKSEAAKAKAAAKAEATALALADKAAALAEDQKALAIALERVKTDRLKAYELKVKMGQRMSAAEKALAEMKAQQDAVNGPKPESPPKYLETLPEPVASHVSLHRRESVRNSAYLSAINMDKLRDQRSARFALIATARALVHTNNCAVCEWQKKLDEQLKSGAPPTQALVAMQNKLKALEHAKQQSGFALDRHKRFLAQILGEIAEMEDN